MAVPGPHRVSLDTGEWLSLGVPAERGRGWKVLAGLLAIGSVTFALSWFVPLYQSHRLLAAEYTKLASEASSTRGALAAGAKAYAALKQEHDALRSTARAAEAREAKRSEQMGRVERAVREKLAADERRGRLAIARNGTVLGIRFTAAALQADGAELTAATKQSLCRIQEALMLMGDVRFRVLSDLGAIPGAGGPGTGWREAAARAGSTADTLVNTCGTEAARVSAFVSPAGAPTTTPASSAAKPPRAPLTLELEPAPAP